MNAEKEENVKRMRIIMGESMGGAVVLRLHRKKPNYWDGGVLVAPMCKVIEHYLTCPFMCMSQFNLRFPIKGVINV